MPKIENIKDLRNDLLEKYESSETDQEKKDLGTFTATASAIIRSVKTELEYNKFKGKGKDIGFLDVAN